MNDALDSRRLATVAQRQATAPAYSAWVEANAGTGKTKVLTDRVTRLLLDGVKPERILCLTFTKAAAAEMRNRLAGQLGRWAMADDAQLDKEIAELIDRPPEEGERLVAHRLFARVLDAPGGINILTIHAFCQALLKRFPLEAGVAPGFDVLDDGEAATLLKQAENDQMEALARRDAPLALRDALATVANKVSITEYTDLMEKLLGERAWLLTRIADEAGLARERMRLAGELGCDPEDSAGAILSSACLDTAFDVRLVREAATALSHGSPTDATRSTIILEWLDDAEARHGRFDDYCKAFFTKEGQILARLATKAAQKKMPDVADVLRGEAERIRAALDRANGAALVERTMALLRLGLDIVERYGRAKRRRGALDYDDLIVATRRLLESAGSAAWVLYKLDGGLDHVLVDEAQDTNPDQWEVIRRLTEEFFVTGSGDERNRTIFAVGDTKQSIFSFQRADPRKLAEMHDWFAGRSRERHRDNSAKRLKRVDLNVSFRSTAAVLDAVDWVFATEAAAKGLAGPEQEVWHRPSRVGQPGRVELWPIVAAEASGTDTTDLQAKPDTLRAPHERLARLIATHMHSLIGAERRANTGELLNAGHFMVLVRRRNALVTALVRELKREGIDVAGVDRLDLGSELAIQDLLALARFVLLPQDDLNLACLLKSPLVGLDEEALFALAYDRKGHLWRTLRSRSDDPRFGFAHARLSAWLARADFTTPFDFFAEALGPEGGRMRLLERLGREAGDPIDELLSRALQYQQTEPGSLQGFLRWFEAGGAEIKRDLDQNRRREVRILTVHAAKGLQAPVVYMPDTTRVPAGHERLLVADDGEARLWLPRANDANERARAWRDRAKARALEEQNRLLYVAMTRAEDRLYVGGWTGAKKQDAGCWYERIEAGLRSSVDTTLPAYGPQRLRAVGRDFDFAKDLVRDGWSGPGFELVGPGEIALPRQTELEMPTENKLPGWWDKPAPGEPDPPTPLAPSQPLPDEAAAQPRSYSPLAADDAKRWQRGLLLHELLRHLPAVAPAERPAVAQRFLAQPAHGLTADEVEHWADEALAVTEAPAHAALFAKGSRAEVPLIGTVQTPRGTFTVSGQVDRLAVTAGEVLIVDYKTNRPPPDSADGVALAYRRQLALYRSLLQAIYPGRSVRAFLLWTAAPRLMEIDGKILDKSMPYAATP
ncbi:MAG: double-strand break repair helicase AddA [Reyranella sp.]|uniref:double-strand break repair helicase AddA n=1 Tax=Reyranella sp. TaxID=1929291 RepID=UPI00121D435F|nr:double-strand break repair helicase AddA [Reyranella sp.]TAJ38958.1 MAG: double-strand break repair helicase AddA [Reyranella sp.]